jgi:NCS1 family nucleobase:cation symporter-1
LGLENEYPNRSYADYLLTKGNVFIGYLYDGTRSNRHYYYHRGWNIQAVIAYLCGIALPFPGFVGTLGAKVSTSATDLGRLGWLLSFSVSFVLYYIICKVCPTKNQKLVKEMGLRWEEQEGDIILAPDGTEIIEEGKTVRALGEISGDTEVGQETYGAADKH